MSRKPQGAPVELTDDNVKYIAHLSRLAISEGDILTYKKNLSEILTFVEQMNACSIEGVQATTLPTHPKQRLREDKVVEANEREAMQAIAPQTEAGLYLVPKVME